MCPSVAVLAGGGDGGGGGGDGAGDGSGDNQAGAGAGGDGAGGDGRGAPGCGRSGGQGCPGPHGGRGSITRGDPVDAVTGRVLTLPVVDLALPGPLLLEFARSYSSSAHARDVGLGFGWGCSLGWEVHVERRNVRVLGEDGVATDFGDVPIGKGGLGAGGWLLLREAWGMVLDTGDGRQLFFAALREGDARYRLTAIEDRHRNRIELTYDDGKLVEVKDSVGRVVRVESTREGRIASLAVKNAVAQGSLLVFARYTYDERGDLVAVTNADGHTRRYRYADHLLVEHDDPTGLTYHFRYDEQRRCVETWGDYPGRADPSLAAGVPAFLADQTTRAKGIYHCVIQFHRDGYSEVVDSVKVQRLFGNAHGKVDKAVWGQGVFTRTYDDLGFELSYTDALGATTKWERDARGRVLQEIDPIGRVTRIARDDQGEITSVIDPKGGITTVASEGDRVTMIDPLGAITGLVTDARGLVVETIAPSGARTRYLHDVHGNVVRVSYDDGTIEEMAYDPLGRMLSQRDARGAVTSYVYSAGGDVVAVRDAAGGVTRFDYDGAGELVRVTFPDGRSQSFERGGHHVVCTVRRPSGDALSLRYDREGRLIEVHDAGGRVHTITRSATGQAIEERTFDGRTIRTRHDLAGRPVRMEDGLGRKIAFEYDLAGQLIARRYADDTEETFTYDAAGDLIGASGPFGEITLERDAVGWVTREAQTFWGETHEITTTYDPMRRAVRRATSLGHVEELTRDGYGRVKTVALGADRTIGIESDAVGQEVRRSLPKGGVIETAFDELCRVVRRRAMGVARDRRAAPMEPAWVGAPEDRATVDRMYRYSYMGELTERWDAARGTTRFEHDPLGRLIAALPVSAKGALFAYDRADALHERGDGAEERVYGPGNRLLRRGDTTYTWSDDGQLLEARTRDRARAYTWTSSGLLERIDEPDGTTIELIYDAFARRMGKRVTRTREGSTEATVTRFVWSGDRIVHEIKRAARASGDPVVLERTYCFEDESFAPLAHRDVTRGEDGVARAGEWLHYVNDPIGAPSHLVADDGALVAEIALSPWGKAEGDGTAATPLRLPGQYEDEETGLSYNRMRYYDPAIGRYISADPWGLLGGLDAFSYAGNSPLVSADPLGLFPTARIVDNRPGGPTRTYNGTSGSGGALDGALQAPLAHAQANSSTASGGRCAEVDALNQMAGDVRSDLRRRNQANNPAGSRADNEPSDRSVRREMARRFRNGQAQISAQNNAGQPMAPCPCCAQLMYNMGIATPAMADARSVPGVRVGDAPWNGRSAQIQQNGAPRNWNPV